MKYFLRAALPFVLVAANAAVAQNSQLDDVRRMYVEAIHGTVEVDSVLDVVASLIEMEPSRVANGYVGALTVLRARPARWPGTKLKYVRRGLALLDPLLEEYPSDVELRFLRLVSCYRLPGILGRAWSVEEDIAEVSANYRSLEGRVEASFYREVEKFVHEHGGQPQQPQQPQQSQQSQLSEHQQQ